MSVLKASDITEAIEVFRQRCRALDVTRDALMNTMLKSLLQTIIALETALECEATSKTRELEEAIKELIIAINDSNFCTTCSDEFGTLACSECLWHQAKMRAIRLLIRLLVKEEEAE